MTDIRRALLIFRFFRIVSPVPRLLMGALATVTMAATVIVVWEPLRADVALTPVLLVQLFAASSGFMLPARRGHYDLLLTSGHPRVAIAVAHWVTAILPGVVSWTVLAVAEIATTRGSAASMLASGTVAALVLVSTLPWALTVGLPRFAGAIGWLLLLALFAAVLAPLAPPRLFNILGGGESWAEAAVALMLYPPMLVGESLAGPQVFLVAPALMIAAGCMVDAVRRIDREDSPLEAAQ